MNYQAQLTNISRDDFNSCILCNNKDNGSVKIVFNCDNCGSCYLFNNFNFITLRYSISQFFFPIDTYCFKFFPNRNDFKIINNLIIFPFNQVNKIIDKYKSNSLQDYINKNINTWKILL